MPVYHNILIILKTGMIISISLTLIAYVDAEIMYVSQLNTSGIENGTTWDMAFVCIEDALAIAKYGDEVWVAAGTYVPKDLTKSRLSVYNVPIGVSLYGGFKGNETEFDQRDINVYETILSGDIGISNDTSDNCFTILYLKDPDERNVIDGLIVQNGMAIDEDVFALSSSPNKSGGGMFITATSKDSEVTIRNCIFKNNRAVYKGGAIYVSGKDNFRIATRLLDCTFIGNYSISGGGAICFDHNLDPIDGLLVNCQFYSNFAKIGGAVYIRESLARSISISNCVFQNNTAYTGACFYFAYNLFDTRLSFINVVLESNMELANTGGAIYVISSSPQGRGIDLLLDSCIISNQIWYDDDDDTTRLGHGLVTGGDAMLNVRISSSYLESAGIELLYSPGSAIIENTSLTGCNYYGNIFDLVKDRLIFNNVNIYRNYTQSELISGPKIIEITNSNISLNSVSEGALILAGSILMSNSIIWENELNRNAILISESLIARNIITDLAGLDSVKWFNEWGILVPTLNIEINDVKFLTDPVFVDTFLNNYRLKSCSPGVNTGSNEATIVAGLYIDFSGVQRIIDDIVDIGPFEHQRPFAFEIQEVHEVTCSGDKDGSVHVLANGADPIVFYWESGTGVGSNLTNLAPGTYHIFIRDGDECLDTLSFSIAEPPPLISEILTTDIDCHDSPSGIAELMIFGGRAPYTINWSNGASGLYQSGLKSGNYNVTISDKNGCTIHDEAIIYENLPINIQMDTIHPSTELSSDGHISLLAITGGVAPYYVEWKDGAVSWFRDSLNAGIYTVYITDDAGCQVAFDIQLLPTHTIWQSIDIGLWPNPINRNIDLTLEVISGQEFILDIYAFDVLGRKINVEDESIDIDVGTSRYKFSLDLPYGVYFFKFLKSDERLGVFKVIVASD